MEERRCTDNVFWWTGFHVLREQREINGNSVVLVQTAGGPVLLFTDGDK